MELRRLRAASNAAWCSGNQSNLIPFFSRGFKGHMHLAISAEKLQVWFARPMKDFKSVRFFGTGNSERALVNTGSILYPSPFTTKPAKRTSGQSH